MTVVMKCLPVYEVEKTKLFGAFIYERELPWLYLKSFDIEAFDGRGEANFTNNINEAYKFASVREAMATWITQSKVRPLRDDGRPNKPLTAFHATFETIDENAG